MEKQELQKVELEIEHDLDKHDYKGVYKELDELRDKDPKHFKDDLKWINKKLEKDGYLPGLDIVEDGKGGFNLIPDGRQPEKDAPHHYNPPSGGYDNAGGNTGGGGGGGFGGEGGNAVFGPSEAGLPSSGPESFDNYDPDWSLCSPEQQDVAQQAAEMEGQQLWHGWPGTENGNLGCAASVSEVLNAAGEAHLSSAAGDALCSTMQKHLMEQGWTVTNKPQPGDVVIGYGGISSAHTGIVGKNGTVYNNHSSTGRWSKDNLSYFSNWNKVVFLKPPSDHQPTAHKAAVESHPQPANHVVHHAATTAPQRHAS